MIQDPPSEKCASLVLFSWGTPAATLSLVGLGAGAVETALIVSPDPDVLNTLAEAAEDLVEDGTVSRLEGLPHEGGAAVTLRRYSLDGLRSLGAPTGQLFDLYPALSERAGLEVSALSGDRLSSECARLPAPVRMVIDMPGHEGALIRLLAGAGDMEWIGSMTIRSMRAPCFDGAESAAAITEAVQEMGFRLQQADDADPDWPVLTFVADPAARRMALLSTELAETRQKLDAAEAAKATAEDALAERDKTLKARDAALAETGQKLDAAEAAKATAETALAERDKTLKTHDAALSETRRKLDAAEAAKATAEDALAERDKTLKARDAALAETGRKLDAAEAAKATAENRLTEQDETLKTRDTALAEVRKKLAAAEKTLAEARQNLDAATKTADKLKSELDAAKTGLAEKEKSLKGSAETAAGLRATVQQLRETIARAENERDERHADLRLAIETASAARADLDDLRQRHAALSDERDSLVELLQTLTPRLREAAEHLRHLPAAPSIESAPAPKAPKSKSKRKKKGQ